MNKIVKDILQGKNIRESIRNGSVKVFESSGDIEILGLKLDGNDIEDAVGLKIRFKGEDINLLFKDEVLKPDEVYDQISKAISDTSKLKLLKKYCFIPFNSPLLGNNSNQMTLFGESKELTLKALQGAPFDSKNLRGRALVTFGKITYHKIGKDKWEGRNKDTESTEEILSSEELFDKIKGKNFTSFAVV